MKNNFKKIISLLLIIGMNWSAISLISGTDAYFNDTETSENNTLTAGTLDFYLSGNGFEVYNFTAGPETINIGLTNESSLAFQYPLLFDQTGGDNDFCESLELEAVNLDGSSQYTGKLTNLNLQSLNGQDDSWSFAITSQSGIDGTCEFDFVFKANQENLSYGNGFFDEEIISNVVSTSSSSSDLKISDVKWNLLSPADANQGVIVSWNTNVLATSEFKYGTLGNCSDNSIPFNIPSLVHKVSVLDLEEGDYCFIIDCIDANNNTDTYNGSFAIEKDINMRWGISINEILPNPDGTDSGNEWVELYNSTDNPIDISEWTGGRSESLTQFIIPDNTFIGPYSFYLIGETDVSDKDFEASLSITNTGANANFVIRDKVGIIIDKVGWDSLSSIYETAVTVTPGSGESIERGLTGYDSDNNSKDFIIKTNPTPTNSGGDGMAEIVINEFLASGVAYDEFVEIYNRSDNDIDVSGWKIEIGDSGDITILNGTLNNKSWMTVYYSGDVLQGVDTITLYDSSDSEIDKISYYDASIEDSSFARIPDGSPNWVDPIPTPGNTNEIEENLRIAGLEDLIEGDVKDNTTVENNFAASEPVGDEDDIIDTEVDDGEETTDEKEEITDGEEVGIIDDDATEDEEEIIDGEIIGDDDDNKEVAVEETEDDINDKTDDDTDADNDIDDIQEDEADGASDDDKEVVAEEVEEEINEEIKPEDGDANNEASEEVAEVTTSETLSESGI